MNSREILGQWIVYLTVNKSPDEKALRELDQLLVDCTHYLYGYGIEDQESKLYERLAQAGYGEK